MTLPGPVEDRLLLRTQVIHEYQCGLALLVLETFEGVHRSLRSSLGDYVVVVGVPACQPSGDFASRFSVAVHNEQG